jgi:hypothetical protein
VAAPAQYSGELNKVIRSQSFSAAVERRTDTTFVKLTGVIDEYAQMPEVQGGGVVVVHLGGVTSINSIGSRAWLGWLQRLGGEARVQLEECPVVFVKSFNFVRGFLATNTKVGSFYVPFYSEATGERRDVLAVRGTHFGVGPKVKIDPPLDSKGGAMELDVVEDSYFGFLRA